MPSFGFFADALGEGSAFGLERVTPVLPPFGRIGFALALTFVEAAG